MRRMTVTIDGQAFEVELEPAAAGWPSTFVVRVDGEPARVMIPGLDEQTEGFLTLVVDDRPYELSFDRDLRTVTDYSGPHEIRLREPEAAGIRLLGKSGPVRAPIPGLITQVLVEAGQAVEAGQPLLVLEAMKMQNEVRAPAAGMVKTVPVQAGQTVARNDLLVEIE